MNDELERLSSTFAFLRGDAPKLRLEIEKALADARDEALEEAAKLMDEEAKKFSHAPLGLAWSIPVQLADKIRALKGKP